MNLVNETIALIVGLLTTFLVPLLNKKFGLKLNPATVSTVATEVLDTAATKLPGIQAPTYPPGVVPLPYVEPAVPPVPMPTVPQSVIVPVPMPTVPQTTNPIPMPTTQIPPMSRPLNLPPVPPNETGAN